MRLFITMVVASIVLSFMYKGRLQLRMNMYKEAIESDFAALKELGNTGC